MECKKFNSEITHDSVYNDCCWKKMSAIFNHNFHGVLLTTLILMGMGIFGHLMAIPAYNPSGRLALEIIENLGSAETSVVSFPQELYSPDVVDNIELESGTTWSYTGQVLYEETSIEVKSYFVFTSSIDVVWLFGTPQGNMFPVGFGVFNPSTKIITFAANNKLHQKISIYYGKNSIDFKFDPSSGSAQLLTQDVFLKDLYSDGGQFKMTKMNYTLNPKKDLVGTFWKIGEGEDSFVLYFKSWNEVDLIGEKKESCAYVYIDDMISIKSGDNVSDENLIGRYRGGDEIPVCREGIDPNGDIWCGKIRKVE